MGDRIHALAQQITGKNSLEECSIDELQHILKRHPYFAPAQFLLLQKLRQSGEPEAAEAQYRKAVLYYHDPLLFEQFIASNKFYTEEWQAETTIADSHVEEQEPAITFPDDQENKQPVADDRADDEAVEESEAIKEEQNSVVEPAVFDPEPAQEPTEGTEQSFHQQEEPSAEPTEAPLPAPVPEANNEPATAEPIADAKQTNAAPVSEEKASPHELTFEPYHTVDYFASQGIKITTEEQPKDKLGKQLKSFTEWLKTMKRLPAAQTNQSVESFAEKKVETLADRSVTESDVVTEAMAEVWLKQGNTEKALDIYNKLSLQNPSKKAYFAAKIENLKQS